MGGEEMKIGWKSCIRIGVSAFLLYLCIYYWPAVSGIIGMIFQAIGPLVTGLITAYLLNILMTAYERRYFPKQQHKKFFSKSKKPVCMIGAIMTLVGIITALIYLVLPELLDALQLLAIEVTNGMKALLSNDWVKELLTEEKLAELASIDWKGYITQAARFLASGVGPAAGLIASAATSLVDLGITIFTGLIFSIYLLYGKDRLQRQFKRLMKCYLPEKWMGKTMHVLSVFNGSFRSYIVGQCTEAAILGGLCAVGMLIFRFPYAGMIGALVGCTALIPIAGAYIGAGVGAIMMLTISPVKALLFLVFIVVLQQMEGNLIYPRVVGQSLGLPAMWVLAAITVGGGLLGIFGMLLGVPLMAGCYQLLKETVKKKEEQLALTEKTAAPPQTEE